MSSSLNGCVTEIAEREALGRDDAHQAPHPLLAARTQRRDDRVVAEAGGERVERHRQVTGVDAQARDRSAGPHGAQRSSRTSPAVPSASIATSTPPPVRRLISAITSCSL